MTIVTMTVKHFVFFVQVGGRYLQVDEDFGQTAIAVSSLACLLYQSV